MSEQLYTRIAKALENTPDDTRVAYRSSLQSQDFSDANSLSSVPIYHCYEYKSLALSLRFEHRTATATVIVWKGYTTQVSTSGTFVAQDVETYGFTAPNSGGAKFDGKFVTDAVLFSNIACRAVKVTLISSCSTGTVDIYIRKISS